MQIYIFDKPEVISGEVCESLISSLPEQRREKAQRYKQPNDRLMCAVSYNLLEYALKKNFGIEQFTLASGENGKPYLAGRGGVYFNISHCANGCAVAVADSEVGVDIQHPVRLRDSVIKRVCSEEERALIAAASDPELTFRGIWCMKEAYLKMLGVGIATDMKKADTAQPSFPAWVRHYEGYSLAACEQSQGQGAEIFTLSVDDIISIFAE